MVAPFLQNGYKSNRSLNNVKTKNKPDQVRESNISCAKGIADAIRTSLGPKGMDKMIKDKKGDVTITNDGATILKQIEASQPAAKMMVELSKAQDVEAGDGTTSVVILAGSLLSAVSTLLSKGIHPSIIASHFQKASNSAVKVLENISKPVDLKDREALIKISSTALNSKVVSAYSNLLAPMAVDAVMKIFDPESSINVNLENVKVIGKLGGTLEDSCLIEGIIFDQKSKGYGGPKKIEKAKIAMIQFCISPPKTDMESNIIIQDYAQMDRVLKEERTYILNIVKQIKKVGCNVLLIQKSILRDAVSDLAMHYFAKMKIMVINDIERDDVDFVCTSLGCKPIASLDHFQAGMLGGAELVEEVDLNTGKILKITGVMNPGKAVSVLLRGSNKLIISEAERSFHDALCVIRCLVKKPALISGGGAPEIELSLRLNQLSQNLGNVESHCFKAFADAMEVIPYTLSENCGLNSLLTVTSLKKKHVCGECHAGISVRKGLINNTLDESIMQPLIVLSGALKLATEVVVNILKIDDIIDDTLILLVNIYACKSSKTFPFFHKENRFSLSKDEEFWKLLTSSIHVYWKKNNDIYANSNASTNKASFISSPHVFTIKEFIAAICLKHSSHRKWCLFKTHASYHSSKVLPYSVVLLLSPSSNSSSANGLRSKILKLRGAESNNFENSLSWYFSAKYLLPNTKDLPNDADNKASIPSENLKRISKNLKKREKNSSKIKKDSNKKVSKVEETNSHDIISYFKET